MLADAGVDRRPAVAELVRAFHPQEFLDGGVDRLGMFGEVAQRIRMAQQQIDAVADQVGRGLVAGVEQEDAIVQKLRLRQPVVLVAARRNFAGIDQGRENFAAVAGHLPLAARNEIAKIILEFGHGSDAAVELLLGTAPAPRHPGFSATSCATGRARIAGCRGDRRSTAPGSPRQSPRSGRCCHARPRRRAGGPPAPRCAAASRARCAA